MRTDEDMAERRRAMMESVMGEHNRLPPPYDEMIIENEMVPENEIQMVDNGSLTFFRVDAPINLCFSDDQGNEIGKFEWNKVLKKWEFTGDMNEAAKQFAKFMYAHFQSLIEGDRDGLRDTPIVAHTEVEKEPEKIWPAKLDTYIGGNPDNRGIFRKMYEGSFEA